MLLTFFKSFPGRSFTLCTISIKSSHRNDSETVFSSKEGSFKTTRVKLLVINDKTGVFHVQDLHYVLIAVYKYVDISVILTPKTAMLTPLKVLSQRTDGN